MIRFGTGGWRAIIGDQFIRLNIQRLTLALSRKMRRESVAERGFVIGYDRRFLSRQAAEWMAEVMAARGIKSSLVAREAPTPLIMFTVKAMGVAYGASVTASHNPALYNGIKLFTEGGRDADEMVTLDLERFIDEVNDSDIAIIPYSQGIRDGLIEEIFPSNRYLDAVITAVNMDAIRARNLRVLLDPMYGVSRTSLQTILLTARCDVDVIHERHDTLFGGRLPAPNAETLNTLRANVVEGGYDIGIATDGDADRIGLIDDAGRFIHPNEILVLLYYYLHKFRGWRGGVVRNVATTHLLDDLAASFNEICYEVPVGFKHISRMMQETGALIGGESSGGMTVRGHISGKDGIYAAVLIVEMLAVTGQKLSQLYREIADQFGPREISEYDTHIEETEKQRLLKRLFLDKQLPQFPFAVDKVSYIDGVKVVFQNGGWIITRFSGTEPLLRILAEMPTTAQALEAVRVMRRFLDISI